MKKSSTAQKERRSPLTDKMIEKICQYMDTKGVRLKIETSSTPH